MLTVPERPGVVSTRGGAGNRPGVVYGDSGGAGNRPGVGYSSFSIFCVLCSKCYILGWF